MSSDFYFFDQSSRASHTGGVYRSKRDSKDFNQALYHLKLASAIEKNHHPHHQHSDKRETSRYTQIKKARDDILLQTTSYESTKPMLPEILTKELDTILQTFHKKSRPISPRSDRSKSSEQDFINSILNLPKVSFPSSLILQLHSTWDDLIQNTNYKYKIWHTKAGEAAWHRHIQQKDSQQLDLEKQEDLVDSKPIPRRRTSSRASISSTGNLSRRQSSTANSKSRLSRSFSRASFLSTSSFLHDNLHLLKSMHQPNSEQLIEPIKNGIHVEFKLSTQNDQRNQKIVLFDVPKPDVNLDEDIIAFTQNKCQNLLAKTKQKILGTTNSKICRIWFYEDNQLVRNRNNTYNQLNRRQKSKFVLSILRYEIPEKYNIHMDIPQTKHKCYVELGDGSTQIYYPSGRLAVLRLRPPISTTLFFDDTNSSMNQFLGLVTSTGNVLLMQPTFYARFITNNQHEYAYLCNGKTGIIEKEIQSNLTNNYQRQSILFNEDSTNSSFFENTIQFEINSYMQLEYHNPSNILFSFKYQNEEFHYQLGIHLPTLINLTTTILATKKISPEKKFQLLTKRSSSVKPSDISNITEKQQIQTRKLSDEQNHSHQLSIMQELVLLRKRVEHICLSWLKECRTTLGVMNIDDYCLSDLPSPPTKQQTDQTNRQSKSANQFIKSLDRQQQFSPANFESNMIANAIEQFVPHSDTGRAIKQRIYTKQILPITLSAIK